MKRIFFGLLIISLFVGSCTQQNRNENYLTEITFMVAADMGRTGVSEQRTIAEQMGRFADENHIDFMAIAGDPVHYAGVTCVNDTVWNERIEYVYAAPSLHAFPWYVVSGNHEYNGSVQAILDYSNVSERWNAPARYFSFTKRLNRNIECLFVFIDTTPLIDRYRNDPDRSDAGEQDMYAQIAWIENTLASSNAKWKIVIGHHPVYAKTTKETSERTDMQERVGVLFEKYGVDFYICGHIHNFQHINREGSSVHYIVNSSASLSRPVHEIDEVEGVVFANPDPGFSVFTVSADNVRFFFVNHMGERVYEGGVVK